jgi:hypothetical protein
MRLTHAEPPPLLCDASHGPTPTTPTSGALALWGGPHVGSSEGFLAALMGGGPAPASPPRHPHSHSSPTTPPTESPLPLATMLPVAPGACSLRTPLRAAIASLHPPSRGGVKTENTFAVLADDCASSAASSSTASAAASAAASPAKPYPAASQLAMVPMARRHLRAASCGSDGDARSETLSETWAEEEEEEEVRKTSLSPSSNATRPLRFSPGTVACRLGEGSLRGC